NDSLKCPVRSQSWYAYNPGPNIRTDRSMHMQLSKRVSIRAIALVFFCVLLLTGSASAQSVASGTIEGTVVDPTGGAVVGANVEIPNPIPGFERKAVTGSAGGV